MRTFTLQKPNNDFGPICTIKFSLMSNSHSSDSSKDQMTSSKFKRVASVTLVAFAGLLVLFVLMAVLNNAERINQMRTEGISTAAVVGTCTGEVGGSGSNSAGYRCLGTYDIHGTSHQEVINGLNSFTPTGSHVEVVVDPKNLTSVETATLAHSQRSSVTGFILPGLLMVLYGFWLGWIFYRRVKGRRNLDS